MLRSLPALLILTACAAHPLAGDRLSTLDQISVASVIGDQLVVDVASRKLLHSGESALDVSAWKIDAALAGDVSESVKARGRRFVAVPLTQDELRKAAGTREGRWKKTMGKQSQALLDLALDASERAGARYLFLFAPPASRESFPVYHGSFGVYCDDRAQSASRAYAYFFLDVALWDVAARRKISDLSVDPSSTQAMKFATCTEVAALKEPVKDLEEPVKHTVALMVENVFARLGWAKPSGP